MRNVAPRLFLALILTTAVSTFVISQRSAQHSSPAQHTSAVSQEPKNTGRDARAAAKPSPLMFGNGHRAKSATHKPVKKVQQGSEKAEAQMTNPSK